MSISVSSLLVFEEMVVSMTCRKRSGVCARAIALLGLCVVAVPAPHVDAGTFRAANSVEVRNIRNQVRAAQFLAKATFGPTETTIDELATRIGQIGYRQACEEWIDTQFALPATSHQQTAYDILAVDGRPINQVGGLSYANYRVQTWWHVALTAEDQLRQRVAWSLSQIFAVGDSGQGFNAGNQYNIPDNGGQAIPLWAGLANYYDKFVTYADGNYRDLLGEVTYHGNMGVWLSSIGNQKALKQNGEITRFPDENYAREIMQLFSVGLYELHDDGRLKQDASGNLIPTYTNDGITELARVFTGFQYSDGNNNDNDIRIGGSARNWGEPMVVYGNRHDNNKNYNEDPNPPASKTVFGITLPPLPANYDSLGNAAKNAAAKAEVEAALDVIAGHDNVGPFISRRLIQRMVKSNPSRAYIKRVTTKWNDNGNGERGDLKAVIKAILLDPELLRGQTTRRVNNGGELSVDVVTRGTEYSRLREPVLRVTAAIRALRPSSDWDGGYMMLTNTINNEAKQGPYKTPTVFNFYLPDYQNVDLVNYTPSRRLPYAEVFNPEFQILDASSAISVADRFKNWCRNRWVQFGMTNGAGNLRITFDLEPELQLARDNTPGAQGRDYDDPNANRGKMKDLLEHFDLLLCNGSLSEGTKRIIYEGLSEVKNTAGNFIDGPNQNINRVEGMLLAILTSPDCAVED